MVFFLLWALGRLKRLYKQTYSSDFKDQLVCAFWTFSSKQASGTFSKWSLAILCLSESIMRQAGTLSWLKSIPIGLHCATFPHLAPLIRVQLWKQKSQVRRLIKALHVHAWTTWQIIPGLHHIVPLLSEFSQVIVVVMAFYYPTSLHSHITVLLNVRNKDGWMKEKERGWEKK